MVSIFANRNRGIEYRGEKVIIFVICMFLTNTSNSINEKKKKKTNKF